MNKSITNKSADDERLEERIRRLVGPEYDTLSEEIRHGMKQQHKLPLLYPGEFVAFRDHWEGQGDDVKLTNREVLRHSRRRKVVEDFILNLGEDRWGVFMEYVEPTKRRSR